MDSGSCNKAGILGIVTAQSPETTSTPRIVAKRGAREQFLSMNLVLEAIVVMFGTVVAVKFAQVGQLKLEAGTSSLWIMGGALAVMMIVASRLQKSEMGRYFGAVLQVPFLAMGLVVDLMIIPAIVFVAIWVASWWLGAKIDRERAEYDAAHPDEAPNA